MDALVVSTLFINTVALLVVVVGAAVAACLHGRERTHS
jgi:hypothetical protein